MRVGLLVFGNKEILPAEVGVLGELTVIWLKEVDTLGELVGRLRRGRSVGGRGAGPGFMNWSDEYIWDAILGCDCATPEGNIPVQNTPGNSTRPEKVRKGELVFGREELTAAAQYQHRMSWDESGV